jgi:uncharacterized coiled-coil protein SlyX
MAFDLVRFSQAWRAYFGDNGGEATKMLSKEMLELAEAVSRLNRAQATPHGATLDRVREQVAELQSQINANDAQTTRLVARIVPLEQQMGGIQADSRTFIEDWRKCRGETAALAKRFNAHLTGHYDRAAEPIDSAEGSMLHARLNALVKRISNIEESYTKPMAQMQAVYGGEKPGGESVSGTPGPVNYGMAPDRLRRLPAPLPKWANCTVARAANAFIVTDAYSQANYGGRTLTWDGVYVFDGMEEVAEFMAAVLNQPREELKA